MDATDGIYRHRIWMSLRLEIRDHVKHRIILLLASFCVFRFFVSVLESKEVGRNSKPVPNPNPSTIHSPFFLRRPLLAPGSHMSSPGSISLWLAPPLAASAFQCLAAVCPCLGKTIALCTTARCLHPSRLMRPVNQMMASFLFETVPPGPGTQSCFPSTVNLGKPGGDGDLGP